jgi:hypothetical protein
MRKGMKILLGVAAGVLLICYGPALAVILAESIAGLALALIHGDIR